MRWRHLRQRRLEAEEDADEKSRRFEEQEAENLRRESEDFLARQMDEMQALAEEQRKAGLLLDDGAPVRLNVSIAGPSAKEKEPPAKEKATVFAHDEEEEDGMKKRRAPLVKLDFSVAETGEQVKERLERIRQSVPHDKETLFKAKVRWDGLTDVRIHYLPINVYLLFYVDDHRSKVGTSSQTVDDQILGRDGGGGSHYVCVGAS